MSGLRNLTTLALLGILSVPPHWCCFIAWGVRGGPECCRSQAPLRIVAANSESEASSPCCHEASVRECDHAFAWRSEPRGQLPCACCTQVREAIAKESSAGEVSSATVPSVTILAPSVDGRSVAIATVCGPPIAARSLQITLCRWLC